MNFGKGALCCQGGCISALSVNRASVPQEPCGKNAEREGV